MRSNSVGIITQARMTSTRLPGKVLLRAGNKSMLEHHLDRLGWANVPIFIATTDNATDEPIVALGKTLGVPTFRGDEHNVLQRFYQTALSFGLDTIVRVTSDCPLIDGKIIREGIDKYIATDRSDVYLSNCLQRTFPRGLDFEIFSMALLADAFSNAMTAFEKEHVTPYINRNNSGRVVIEHFLGHDDASDLRWTLDTPDDLTLLRTLIEEYRAEELPYSGVLQIVRDHPHLSLINTHIKQKEF